MPISALLTEPRGGATLVTLAPECVPPGFVAALARAGVRVALGHSMASYEQTRAALAEGLTGFTHLFNAMRPLRARDPGPIAAALEDPRAFYGLIVDGEHVAPAMLRLALRGVGHAMLVTDAMPPVGGSRRRVPAHAARILSCATAALRPPTACSPARRSTWRARCATACACSGWACPRRCVSRRRPRPRFSACSDRLGRLAPGYRADIVALDPDEVRVLATWVAGEGDETAPERGSAARCGPRAAAAIL